MEIREIPGYEGLYSATSTGQIYSHYRNRILRSSPDNAGYLQVTIRSHFQSKAVRTRVHRLVCLAFHGEPTDCRNQARHLDDIRTNNMPENLRWGTRSDNMKDKIRNGHYPQAEQTHCLRGHALTGYNCLRYNGKRACRTCARAANRRCYASKKNTQ